MSEVSAVFRVLQSSEDDDEDIIYIIKDRRMPVYYFSVAVLVQRVHDETQARNALIRDPKARPLVCRSYSRPTLIFTLLTNSFFGSGSSVSTKEVMTSSTARIYP